MINAIIEAIDSAIADLTTLPKLTSATAMIEGLDEENVGLLLEHISDKSRENPSEELFHAINPVLFSLAAREQKNESQNSSYDWPEGRLEQLLAIYKQSPSQAPVRNSILYWLAPGSAPYREKSGRVEAWVDVLSNDPPAHRSSIPVAFGPAITSEYKPEYRMLERLLEGSLQHIQVAPAVFDLLNFYVRNGQIDKHPANSRTESLTELLGQLTGQLGKIEGGEIDREKDPGEIGRQVSDSVALIVSLCDTLALLEYEPAIGKINQAAGLRHRRVQTEAAAALARLGDDYGSKLLVELANEPVARLRVLNYAEELGLTEEISIENRGEIAIVESHLAIWLSEPAQMGISPSRINLVDNREMYWPGYEQPMQCYLFKFEYGNEERPYSNIAICGPMTHAFSADLTHLPHEDIYALFAGWQTVHDEIFQIAPERAQQAFPNEWRHAETILRDDEDLSEIQIEISGKFFGRLAIGAACVHATKGPGTAIVDDRQVYFIEAGTETAPIDSRLAFSIWQGRQLLTTFNPA